MIEALQWYEWLIIGAMFFVLAASTLFLALCWRSGQLSRREEQYGPGPDERFARHNQDQRARLHSVAEEGER